MGLIIKQLPKGHPDVLVTVPDRQGFHEKPTSTDQTLVLPSRQRHHRNALRALDMSVTPSQRETVYNTIARRPSDSNRITDGQIVHTEKRSPSNSTRRNRLSLSGFGQRSRQTPVIVQKRSPTLYAEDTFARLPDFHPAQLPQPDPYPVFIHAPATSKQTQYESDEDDLSSDSEVYAKSASARLETRAPPTRQRRSSLAPPPVPDAPEIVLHEDDQRRSRRSRRSSRAKDAPVEIYESDHYIRYEVDDDRPRRSRSYRDSGHHHRSHHRHRSQHRHESRSRHRSASRSGIRHARSEPDRERDFLVPAPDPPRARSRAATSVGPAPQAPAQRQRSATSANREEIKGMLEDPRDVRAREYVTERQFLAKDGTKVKQYQYSYRA